MNASSVTHTATVERTEMHQLPSKGLQLSSVTIKQAQGVLLSQSCPKQLIESGAKDGDWHCNDVKGENKHTSFMRKLRKEVLFFRGVCQYSCQSPVYQ